MDPAFHYPGRQVRELEDLVATFVENKLGRQDWSMNWPVWKTKNQPYLDKIRGFFAQIGEDVNPLDVERYLDQMILTRPGRWR